MKSETCPACKMLIDKDAAICPECGFDLAGNRYAAIARQQQQDRLVLEKVKSDQKMFGIHYETASETAAKLSKGRMIAGILLTFAGVPLTLFCLLNIFLSAFAYGHNDVLVWIFCYLSLMFGSLTAIGIKLLTPPKPRPPVIEPGSPVQSAYDRGSEPFSRPSLSPPPAEYGWQTKSEQKAESVTGSAENSRQDHKTFEENGTEKI